VIGVLVGGWQRWKMEMGDGVRASCRHCFRLDYRNLEEQLSDGKIANVSLAEIKTAIEQLSFEERAELAAWLHGWKDDEWDEQMKRDIASGKLDDVLREVGLGSGVKSKHLTFTEA